MADHTRGQDKRNEKLAQNSDEKTWGEEYIEELGLDMACCMGRGARRFLVGKPERKRPLERLSLR
jgi:hypothetical protein